MNMSLYDDLIAAGIETDHHESDLYAPDTPEVRAIVGQYPLYEGNVHPFTVQEGHPNAGQRWLDIPFAFTPFWEAKP